MRCPLPFIPSLSRLNHRLYNWLLNVYLQSYPHYSFAESKLKTT
ncbi:hypothetical protein QWZ13_01930 [Reinekea marina]|nr:hypothetical protein [Reinekea marina]MDN3647665.1 hypothetical protein [Reinekea marina]